MNAAMNTLRNASAAGIASEYLAGAAQHARACARLRGNLAAAWMLLGDALLAHHAVTPLSPAGTEPLQQCVYTMLRPKLESAPAVENHPQAPQARHRPSARLR